MLLIGPWLDEHVAEAVLAALPPQAGLRVLTRPYDATSEAFVPHARAAHQAILTRAGAQVRVLRTLHAKVIVIDDETTYCGSANWYRYSLEIAREVVLRGPAEEASGLLDLAEALWQAGVTLSEEGAPVRLPITHAADTPVGNGYRDEALDPLAARVLREVKGAFLLSKHKR